MKPHKLTIAILLSCLFLFAPATGVYAFNLIIVNSNNNPSSGPFQLISSNPADWQTLDNAPTRISFTFSQPVQPDKSWIRVYNVVGDQLDVGDLEVQDKSMSATLSDELTAGKYIIKWKAHCQCNDNTEISDSFHFTVQ